MISFNNIFVKCPDIHIVDIGASPIEGDPAYQPILDAGGYRLTCFEPNPVMFEELRKLHNPNMTILPYAIGDGMTGTLHICAAPGMTSLLEPDLELLSHFHGFGEWGKVIDQIPLVTHRLDDLDDVNMIDFLKIDVQGSELAILENATRNLRTTLVIHVETLFVPFYRNQPLFGEIDLLLRKAGFLFHKFGPLVSRVFKPLIVNNDLYAGLNQVLWSDAVYVRSFMDFKSLSPHSLMKIARILHDVYGSYDLALVALQHIDRQQNSNLQAEYLKQLSRKE